LPETVFTHIQCGSLITHHLAIQTIHYCFETGRKQAIISLKNIQSNLSATCTDNSLQDKGGKKKIPNLPTVDLI